MTKELFLEILKDGLYDFPEGELSDILYDYKEHFDVGFASGKNEDEIIEELGAPHNIVNQYRNGYLKKYESESETEAQPEPETKESTNSDSNNSYTKDTNNENSSKPNDKSNSFIITSLIILLSLIVFGPIATALVLGIMGLFLGLFGGSLGLLVASGGVLIGKFITNTVGVFTFPDFILNFPDSVLALILIGSLCMFILSIISLYYLIKQFIRWIKQLVNWTSTKLKGE